MIESRFVIEAGRGRELVVDIAPVDSAYSDGAVLRAFGPRGGLKAHGSIVPSTWMLEQTQQFKADLTALARAEEPNARLRVGGFVLVVCPNRIRPAVGEFVVECRGKRGGVSWAGVIGRGSASRPVGLEALRQACDAIIDRLREAGA